jgi:hypothetical protein
MRPFARRAFGPGAWYPRMSVTASCYDAALHAAVTALRDRSLSLQLIWRGMEAYPRRNPAGKKLHDPLAACCAIDETIGTWAEVEVFQEKGGWGARLASSTGGTPL